MPQPVPPFVYTVDYDAVTARSTTIDLGDTPEGMRAGFTKLLLGEHPEADARPLVKLGGVEARLSGVVSLEGYTGKVLVWFHGGGYVFGSPETHQRLADRFAKALGIPVVLPRYRLAPEHKWPAQLDDAEAVVGALQQQGCAVLLGGDSAGGHLALNAALKLAKSDTPAEALVLFSPNTDRSGLNTTRAVNSDSDPVVDDSFDVMLAGMCFPEDEWPADHPEVSPVRADLGLLPRTHIEIGGRELLRDDSTILYAFAKTAGADITLHETPEAFHMWQVWVPWLEAGAVSIERAAAAVRG